MSDEKVKLQTRKVRYMKDPLPVRLGNLASNLARLRSFVSQPEAASRVMRESKHFIEWAGPEAELSVQIELVALQRLLAYWHGRWPIIQGDIVWRQQIAEQAQSWSQRILELSGLLNPVTTKGS
ncbi:MAG: hypothetical protein JNJ50_09120 [Acidobacteria bacterium]|jgi:hypothetical protein|nr:hypothetical protein [Acidobacteriota bacterium]